MGELARELRTELRGEPRGGPGGTRREALRLRTFPRGVVCPVNAGASADDPGVIAIAAPGML